MDSTKLYIAGEWCSAKSSSTMPLIDPASEKVIAQIGVASSEDVDRACSAAADAAPAFASTEPADRLAMLDRLQNLYQQNAHELASLVSREMGAPRDLAARAHVDGGARQLGSTIKAARRFRWQHRLRRRDAIICHESIGVCGLITPWNWPLIQIMAKISPALACGCPVVLKPSEQAPLSSLLIGELVERAGVPAGVFNLINGPGPTTGTALAAHALPRMISFTGSTDSGRAVSVAAAATVKRVTLELGGKSACLVFADADLTRAIRGCLRACFRNSGQSCNAPSRLLVERSVYEQALALLRDAAAQVRVAAPSGGGSHLGPVANEKQFKHAQDLIESGIASGATLLAGGLGRVPGLSRGFYVRPSVFADVDNAMRIAREEVFAPVLCVIPFDDEVEAIAIANDSQYGLAAYLHTGDAERAQRVASKLEVGMVQINGAAHSSLAPFGGYKQSGNGREYGEYGLREYMEIKTVSERRRATT